MDARSFIVWFVWPVMGCVALAVTSAHVAPPQIANHDEFSVTTEFYRRLPPIHWTCGTSPVMIVNVNEERQDGIRHVMFDADGVLQQLPGGWVAAAEPYFGERTMDFLRRAYAAELPTLAGEGDFHVILAAVLAEFEVTAPLEDVFRDIWLTMVPAPASLALVRALRADGYGVHLGTNQDRHRAAHMREVLGYDALFDVSCYSWELGAAKPDPAFFTAAARRIGAEPAAIMFIDDAARNVAAAQEAGLIAEQWSLDDGHDALRSLLARHGVACLRQPHLGRREYRSLGARHRGILKAWWTRATRMRRATRGCGGTRHCRWNTRACCLSGLTWNQAIGSWTSAAGGANCCSRLSPWPERALPAPGWTRTCRCWNGDAGKPRGAGLTSSSPRRT